MWKLQNNYQKNTLSYRNIDMNYKKYIWITYGLRNCFLPNRICRITNPLRDGRPHRDGKPHKHAMGDLIAFGRRGAPSTKAKCVQNKWLCKYYVSFIFLCCVVVVVAVVLRVVSCVVWPTITAVACHHARVHANFGLREVTKGMRWFKRICADYKIRAGSKQKYVRARTLAGCSPVHTQRNRCRHCLAHCNPPLWGRSHHSRHTHRCV